MTKKTPAEAIRDLTVEFGTRSGAGGMADTAGLASGINEILADADVLAALEAADPEQAAQLRDLMAQMQSMEALTAELVSANAAGDDAALERLSGQMQGMSTVPEYQPEKFPPPFDAIQDAIWEDDLAALEAALLTCSDLNVHLGQYSSFPLSMAAMSAGETRLAMLGCLLDHGARADFATPEGSTALHVMIDSPDRDDTVAVIDLLLAHGADIEARNHYGWTPMLQAVMEGSVLVLEALQQRGADVHARFDEDASMPAFSRGCTAMMVAAYEPDKVKTLLSFGADPAGAHTDGRGFNAYADDAIAELVPGDEFFNRIEASRVLINAARLN